MKFFPLVALLLVLTSCYCNNAIRRFLPKECVELMQDASLNSLASEHEKKMKSKYGMTLLSKPCFETVNPGDFGDLRDLHRYRWGKDHYENLYNINKIEIGYIYPKKAIDVEIDGIFEDTLNSFLNLVNSHPKFRTYMHEHPFTEKNIVLTIRYLKTSDGTPAEKTNSTVDQEDLKS